MDLEVSEPLQLYVTPIIHLGWYFWGINAFAMVSETPSTDPPFHKLDLLGSEGSPEKLLNVYAIRCLGDLHVE